MLHPKPGPDHSAAANKIEHHVTDEHKYKIGEAINFRSSTKGRFAPPGEYRVIAHRPPENGEPLYRIKSELERHDRIARESELTWIR